MRMGLGRSVDYKKELEKAAKTMILVHEPDALIKMIVRMLVQKVRITHAGILLHDKARDTYILTVSKGAAGFKIPAGFARIDSDNPLVRFFKEGPDKKYFSEGVIIYGEAKKAAVSKGAEPRLRELAAKVAYQMEIYEAVACIPTYFRDELLGILLLGGKKSGGPFSRDELSFFMALASDVAMGIRNAQLFRELELELDKRKRLFINTTVALAAAIDAKDHYTHGHTARVTNLSLEIAQRLKNRNKYAINDKAMEDLQIASLLHDIGKIGVPESILNKEGSLNEEEHKKMREHPILGVTIIQAIKELEDAVMGVKYHHERFDGLGYPEGLKGENIPLIAAIISVADSYDAMTTDRPYRPAMQKDAALAEIKRLSGLQFNPRIVEIMAELSREDRL